MADFASIYGLANKPTTELQSPMHTFGQAMQMKNLSNQNQLGGMQVQQQQMALHDQQVMSQLMQTGKYNMGDPNSVKQMAADAGQAGASPSAVMSLSQHSIDQQQKIAATAASLATAAQRGGAAVVEHQKLISQQVQDAATLTLTAKTPEDWQNGLASLDQKYAAAGAPPLSQKYGEFTPANVSMLRANGMTYQQAFDLAYGKPQSGPMGMNQVYPPTAPGGMPTVTPIPGTAPAQSPVAKVQADLKAGLIDQATAKKMIDKETHIAPSTVQLMTSATQNFDPSKPLPAALESQAQATKETGVRLTPSSRNPQAWQTNARADYLAQQDGGTVGGAKQQYQSATKAREYFTTGAGATAIRQQETILHHADVFTKIFDALDNGDVQSANKLGNAFGVQFGSDKASNAKIAGTILSAEVGKYLAGGQSTEGERAELANLIPTFSSPQQARGGLQTLKNLVEGQRQSWMSQRDSALKGQVTGSSASAPNASQPAQSEVPGLSNFHFNPQTKQRIGQDAQGNWVDAATGKRI